VEEIELAGAKNRKIDNALASKSLRLSGFLHNRCTQAPQLS